MQPLWLSLWKIVRQLEKSQMTNKRYASFRQCVKKLFWLLLTLFRLIVSPNFFPQMEKFGCVSTGGTALNITNGWDEKENSRPLSATQKNTQRSDFYTHFMSRFWR